MSACGTLNTILNYMIMFTLILATLSDVAWPDHSKPGRVMAGRAAFGFGMLWLVMSIWQLANT